MPSPEMVKAHDIWRGFRDASLPSDAVPDIDLLRKRWVEWISQFPTGEGVTTEDVDTGGVPAVWTTPPRAGDGVVFYLHGGGYVIGDPWSHRSLTDHLAIASGTRLLSVDYRIAPEHACPAAVDDALTAYRWLLGQGVTPSKVVIGGDSAGGGLTLATLLALRDAGDPLPAGAVALSPWADLSCSGESMTTKADLDPILEPMTTQGMAMVYLMSHDPQSPLASPLQGDLSGLPPILIQVGSSEILLDDAVRFAERAQAAGTDVTLEVEDGAPHVWQVFSSFLPEAEDAIQRIGAFVRARVS